MFHALLAFRTDGRLCLLLQVSWRFSLTTFNILSLFCMFDIFTTMYHGDYAFWTQLYAFLATSYIGYLFLHIDLGAFSAKISSRYFLCLKFFVSALFSFSWILKFSFFIRFQSSWRLCSFLLTSFPLLPSEWNTALILLLSLGAVGLSQVCPYWTLFITVIWRLFFLHLKPRI